MPPPPAPGADDGSAPPAPDGLGAAVLEEAGGSGAPTEMTPAGDPGDGGAGDGDTPEGAGPPAPQKPRQGRWLVEAAVIVIAALLLAIVLRTFVVQTFYIPSGSMEPTLQIGDRILVDKLSYHLHAVHRGDIIVFQRPADEHCGGPQVNDLVKRVVGLPGEVLTLSEGQVYVNGKELREPWLPEVDQGVTAPGPSGVPFSLNHAYRVPAGEYFLMGDNRVESCDSRYWGPIPKKLIVGKVVVRIWPLSQFHIF